MDRLRLTHRIGNFGEYAEIEMKFVNLQCSYKYKIFWMEMIGWKTIFSIREDKLPPFNNKKNLLKIMTDLWLKERKETLPTRLKQKVVNKLEYST